MNIEPQPPKGSKKSGRHPGTGRNLISNEVESEIGRNKFKSSAQPLNSRDDVDLNQDRNAIFPELVRPRDDTVETSTRKKTKKKKPLFQRMIEESNKLQQKEEQERNEARLKRKMELQKANFSLAAIREHIAKHDELMQQHKQEHQEQQLRTHISPSKNPRLHKLRESQASKVLTEEGAGVESDVSMSRDGEGSVGGGGGGGDDDSSIGASSFLTASRDGIDERKKKKRKGKRIKTKSNSKIKLEIMIEKQQRDKEKAEVVDRIKKRENFAEHVKKHKMPSPHKYVTPLPLSDVGVKLGFGSAIKSSSSMPKVQQSPSSIPNSKTIDDMGDSFIVSQVQINLSPRLHPLSAGRSHSRLSDYSPRKTPLTGHETHTLKPSPRAVMPHHLDHVVAIDTHGFYPPAELFPPLDDEGGDGEGDDERGGVTAAGVSNTLKYQYPDEVAAESAAPVAAATVEFKHRAAWITAILEVDPDEDNLCEIYEAGFSMYLAEKGIAMNP